MREQKLSLEDKIKQIQKDLDESVELDTQFATLTPVIQAALNRDASIHWIWAWLRDDGSFKGCYMSFLRRVRKSNLRKQSQSEIEAQRQQSTMGNIF